MHIERLVRMANAIGDFFAAEPENEQAVKGAAAHFEKFWEPRMRRQILSHLDVGGEGLTPLVREALSRLAPPNHGPDNLDKLDAHLWRE